MIFLSPTAQTNFLIYVMRFCHECDLFDFDVEIEINLKDDVNIETNIIRICVARQLCGPL